MKKKTTIVAVFIFMEYFFFPFSNLIRPFYIKLDQSKIEEHRRMVAADFKWTVAQKCHETLFQFRWAQMYPTFRGF